MYTGIICALTYHPSSPIIQIVPCRAAITTSNGSSSTNQTHPVTTQIAHDWKLSEQLVAVHHVWHHFMQAMMCSAGTLLGATARAASVKLLPKKRLLTLATACRRTASANAQQGPPQQNPQVIPWHLATHQTPKRVSKCMVQTSLQASLCITSSQHAHEKPLALLQRCILRKPFVPHMTFPGCVQ